MTDRPLQRRCPGEVRHSDSWQAPCSRPALRVCLEISPGTREESSRHHAAPAVAIKRHTEWSARGLEPGPSVMSMSGGRATDTEPCKTETR
jgi:hypothetical protein